MKKFTIVIVFLGAFVAYAAAQSGKDTLNYTDANSMKQGHWVYYNRELQLPDFKDNQKVEEGHYFNDQKNGKWIHYFPNDKPKDVITYVANRPNGYAVFYYASGSKREEGTWRNNRWVGDYKYYHENGEMASDWKYNSQGTRTGVQKYYHENGRLMIEGEWIDGKENGVIKEYYDNSELKSEKNYSNGSFDVANTKTYVRKTAPTASDKPQEGKATASSEKVVITEDKAAYKTGVFDGNGMFQLKDRNGRVIREGLFDNGFLKNGKVFQYSADGRLFKTTIYNGGKVINVIDHQ